MGGCVELRKASLVSLWALYPPDVPVKSDGGSRARVIRGLGSTPLPPSTLLFGFSWEHLTSVDLESQLWSQNLTLGNTAAEPEQEWTVTPVMTDIELN